MTTEREILDRLDGWVNDLAAPLGRPQSIADGDGFRLAYASPSPQAAVTCKLVRAVSGLRGALLLAEAGYVAECGSVLRVVRDACLEVRAITEALNRGGEHPRAVADFVDQFFEPRARTPDEYATAKGKWYVARKGLMKAEIRLCEGTSVDVEELLKLARFLNMSFDAYVHAAYDTAMELCHPVTGRFEMRGHPVEATRQEFVSAVFRTMHEVVTAVEVTAAVTSHAPVFKAAREARRTLDQLSLAD